MISKSSGECEPLACEANGQRDKWAHFSVSPTSGIQLVARAALGPFSADRQLADYQDLADEHGFTRNSRVSRTRLAFFRMRMSGVDSEREEVFIVTGQCG